MSVEIIGKLVQKNNGTFKLMDADNVEYDDTNSIKDKIHAHELQIVAKADKAYVDNKLAEAISIAPKGIGTFAELTTKYPTGTTGIFIVQEDGLWYYWNELASLWTPGGSYQSSGGGENTSTNPYSSLYFKDIINNEVYQVYSNNGNLKTTNTSPVPKLLSKISATKTKTVYNMDEQILVNDIAVTATYTDGTSAVVEGWYSNIEDLDTFTEGLKTLVISYTRDNITLSTTIYISVQLSVSCNGKQYVSLVNNSGVFKHGVELVKSTERIFKRDKLNIRFRIRVVITRNRNTSGYTTIGAGNYTYWDSVVVKSILLLPGQTGEFLIECNSDFDYPTANVAAGVALLSLYSSSASVEGNYVLEQYSVALVQPAVVEVSSITATKTITRYFSSDTINLDDIVVTAHYSNDASAVVSNFTTNMSSIDLSIAGNTPLIVSYTENGVTQTATISLNIYKGDFIEPQPFTIRTAQEFADVINFGWNLGNNLDSRNPTGDFGEDKYLNQETLWGQPKIQQSLFPLVKAQGFNTIRIPVTWYYNSYIDADGNRHIGKFWLAKVREVIDWALDEGFYVIMNSHHDMNMFKAGVPASTFAAVLKDANTVWVDIANKFKHYGDKLIFEAFNEIDNIESSWSFGALAANQMNQLNQVFVDTVRATGSNNVNRILIVPTLIDAISSDTLNAFIMPIDPVENKLMVEVHTYPSIFLQNINPLFESLQEFSARISAPTIVGEWGTTNISFSGDAKIRVIHASNFVARAKAHNIKTIYWDNGTTASSKSDYALIDRYTNTVKYPNMIKAINDGYNLNIAYRIPSQYIYTVDSMDKVVYLTLNTTTGTVKNTYWGTLTTDFIPVLPGNTLTASVNVSGAAATAKISLATIVFYDSDYAYISGSNVAYQVFNVNKTVPEGAVFARVSINSPHNNVTQNSYTTYINTDVLQFSVENYSLASIESVNLGAAPSLVDITVTKTIITYNTTEQVTLDDIVVTAMYSNDSSAVVSGWTSNYDSVDWATEGDKVLVINYIEGADIMSTEIKITIVYVAQTTYEWNGEETLPTGLTLSTADGGTPLVTVLGDDGKYYFAYNTSTYGNGVISLTDSIRPTTGTTTVTAKFDVLALGTGTNAYGSIAIYLSDDRRSSFYLGQAICSCASLTTFPALTVGEHTLKLVARQSKNNFDVYLDDVVYGTNISQYMAGTTTMPNCSVTLNSFSKDKVKLKSFKYHHIG